MMADGHAKANAITTAPQNGAISSIGPSPMPRPPSAASAYREYSRRRMLFCSIHDPLSSAYNLRGTRIVTYTKTRNKASDGRLRARRRPVLREGAATADIIWWLLLTQTGPSAK